MNRWIADRGYGSGMALAFSGDADFLRRSTNFAINFLVHDASNVHQHSPTFITLNTTMERLRTALYNEAFAAEMIRLKDERGYLDNALNALQDEDYPADFIERCEKFRADLWFAADSDEVAEVLKRDPTKGIFDRDDSELEAKANEFALNKADEQLAALHFEDFMKHASSAGVFTHELVEIS